MTRRNTTNTIESGVLLVCILHILLPFIAFLLLFIASVLGLSNLPVINWLGSNYRFLWLFFAPGLTQLIFVIPLVIWCGRKRQFERLKGVAIAAVVIALLNGGCWLLI